MCPSLVPEWLDEFYSYLVFRGLSFMGQCLVNMNILVPKTRGLPKQNVDFLKNCPDFH
jgi:hypothetical protein